MFTGFFSKTLLCAFVLLVPRSWAQQEYTYITNNGTITITGYTGPGGNVTIPATINGRSVTSIGFGAFEAVTSLTAVTLPSTVRMVEGQAFYRCSNLGSV